MEGRIEGAESGLERLRPRVNGGAFRRPPVLPVAFVFTLLAGVAIGVNLAPTPPPSPSPMPTLAAVAPTPSPTPSPTEVPTSYSQAIEPVRLTYSYCDDTDLSASSTFSYSTCTYFQRPASPGSPPSGSISIERAIAAARSQPGFTGGQVIWAQLTDNSGYFQPVDGSSLWVWELRIGGSIGPCATELVVGRRLEASSICGEVNLVVVVDAMSGEVLLTSTVHP